MDIEKDEVPAALPKQFSESLKRIGEQAKEWQSKKLDTPATEEEVIASVKKKVKAATAAASASVPVAPVATPPPVVLTTPVSTKQQFNWSATALVMTVLVLLALVLQTLWFSQKLESLTVANKDLQLQVQGLTQELRDMQEAARAQAAAAAAVAAPTEPTPTADPNAAAQPSP